MYAYTYIILMCYIFKGKSHFILIHKSLVNFAIQHLFINTIFTNFVNFSFELSQMDLHLLTLSYLL